jgi:hypothetical protein
MLFILAILAEEIWHRLQSSKNKIKIINDKNTKKKKQPPRKKDD